MRRERNTGPSVSEIKLRGDLDRAKRELAKLKKAGAAAAASDAAESAADDAAGGVDDVQMISEVGLAATVVELRAEIAELTETRHRLSKLYFQQLEDSRRRATRLRTALDALALTRGDDGPGALFSRLAECVREHTPFRMVVARARNGERMEAVSFAGVPETARAAIAARTPSVRDVESWMDAPHNVGGAFHVPHNDPLNAGIPGWVPTLDERQPQEWHADDVLLVPVRAADGTLSAVFSLDDPADRAVPSSETLEMLSLVAHHAALALDNLRLRGPAPAAAAPVAGAPNAERRARMRELRASWVAAIASTVPGWSSGNPEASEDGMDQLFGRMAAQEGPQARLAARLESLDRVEDALLAAAAGPGNLGGVLGEVALALQPIADRGRIALKVQNAATDTEVEAGRELLRELVLELGRNALRFTPPGGTVNFRLSGDASDLMLEVADSGSGIEPARLPHVFDVQRGASAAVPGNSETGGIGLAICKSIVEWHGGRIFLESGAGRGTRVSVILPRRGPGRKDETKHRHGTPGKIIPLPAPESGRREAGATDAPDASAASERGR